MKRDYEGYAVYNKKTDKIVKVPCAIWYGNIHGLAFTNKEVLKMHYKLKPNEEIRRVRVIDERSFE